MSEKLDQLIPTEMHGWEAADEVERYDPQSIFDYIDGAGEVYRSYAFKQVVVRRFTRAGSPGITVEVFDMATPEDAYGVFSYAREEEQSGIGGGYERHGGVICFWQNRYYVCVAAEESTDETRSATLALARAVSERLPTEGEVPQLVRLLPERGKVSHSERFFHIHPSLNYHYFLAEQNILDLSRETNAVLAAYRPGSAYLLCIEYQTREQAQEALNSFLDQYLPEADTAGVAMVDDAKWARAVSVERFLIITLDAVGCDEATVLVNDMKRSLVAAKLVTGDEQ